MPTRFPDTVLASSTSYLTYPSVEPKAPVALGLHCPLAGRIRTHKYRALCSGIGKANDPRWRPAARPAAVAEMIEVNRGTRENEIRGAIANDDAKGAGSHSNLRI